MLIVQWTFISEFSRIYIGTCSKSFILFKKDYRKVHLSLGYRISLVWQLGLLDLVGTIALSSATDLILRLCTVKVY